MRLSEWRKRAPARDSVAPKVQAVVETALTMLGGGSDPDCWVAWGDDPSIRYMILVPTQSGLAQVNVRVNVPGEGPRASGKIVRWSRVQLGELGVEMQGGHRLISFQVESQVLNGADAAADAIAQFAQVLFAAVDGRAAPVVTIGRRARATKGTSRAAAKPSAKTQARPAAARRAPKSAASAPATATPPATKSALRIAAPKGP